MNWSDNLATLQNSLDALLITDQALNELSSDEGFGRWCQRTVQTRTEKRTVYLIGNGASASMASHMAADLAKNALVHTETFTDLSLLTAIANDISYDQVFAEPLSRRMRAGDMLVAISSSGNSPNILRAAETARERGGFVVTLSAMKGGNALRKAGDLNAYVPALTYGMAESCHAAILHHWMDLVAASTAVAS